MSSAQIITSLRVTSISRPKEFVRRMLKDADDGGGADSEDEIDDEAEGVGVLVAEKTTEQQMLDAIIDAGARL